MDERKPIWLDYYPPGQTERGVFSHGDHAPTATAMRACEADGGVDRATANRLIAELHAKLDAANADADRLAAALRAVVCDYSDLVDIKEPALAAHEARNGGA